MQMETPMPQNFELSLEELKKLSLDHISEFFRTHEFFKHSKSLSFSKLKLFEFAKTRVAILFIASWGVQDAR